MPENDNPSGPNRPSGDQLTPGPAGTGENELRWPTFEFAAGLAVAVGFLVRLSIAARSFLNGDEALHFMAANQPSWKLTYQASLTISHPPLLIFLMHIWRDLGSSELVLRLPSVIAGAAFCWILYKWVAIVFGRQTGVIAAIFASFLPPLISLSAEIRQYAFLLFLAASTMYLLERAFAENSWKKMSAASVCLWLAILSHYSAVLLAFVLAIYAPLRMLQARQKRGLMVAWVTGQIGAVLLCFWLYLAYISVFGGRALHSWMDIYLHNSYFDPRRGHVLVFAVAVHAYGLRRGDLVWVLQAGWRWEDSLARQLQVQYSQFSKLKSYSFGNNITIFQLRVGEPLPSIAAHLSYIESIPPGSVVAGADNHAAVVDLSQ
jgi:Dolichyl-phosphate-mannose-protein mannosyltransferase